MGNTTKDQNFLSSTLFVNVNKLWFASKRCNRRSLAEYCMPDSRLFHSHQCPKEENWGGQMVRSSTAWHNMKSCGRLASRGDVSVLSCDHGEPAGERELAGDQNWGEMTGNRMDTKQNPVLCTRLRLIRIHITSGKAKKNKKNHLHTSYKYHKHEIFRETFPHIISPTT